MCHLTPGQATSLFSVQTPWCLVDGLPEYLRVTFLRDLPQTCILVTPPPVDSLILCPQKLLGSHCKQSAHAAHTNWLSARANGSPHHRERGRVYTDAVCFYVVAYELLTIKVTSAVAKFSFSNAAKVYSITLSFTLRSL